MYENDITIHCWPRRRPPWPIARKRAGLECRAQREMAPTTQEGEAEP